MTYEEWDRRPERNWTTYRITGWLPEDAIGKEQRRTYFHLTVDGAAPDGEWTIKIDNHRFQLFLGAAGRAASAGRAAGRVAGARLGSRVTIAMLLTTEAGDERKHARQVKAFASRCGE